MKRYQKIIFICMALIIVVLGVFLIIERNELKEKCTSNNAITPNDENKNAEELNYDCSFTQTWKVYNLLENYTGHHPDVSYVILEKFQTTIPYSHIIPSNLKSKLEQGKYYEFTYHIKGKGNINDINDITDKIIPEDNVKTSQSNLIVTLSIKETDKLGLEQLQEPICSGTPITNE